MDEIVKQAMAKWPNVPHCYGWLALDARGAWRMRDEAAQRAGAPGDKLTNAALVGFINRNYLHDERGCWYFQNGPQRVYVNLEATPFIARTDPLAGFLLHTGRPLGQVEQAFMTDLGQVILQGADVVAQVDDRDVAQLLPCMELDGAPVTDDALAGWIEHGGDEMLLRHGGKAVRIEHLRAEEVAARFRFIMQPQLPG
ncbi:DUF2946 family protein [Massilia solisilvae]|uniref:DUF2946 family protein n=1 Tax=Massilia solisilvae TaxID=1811225 RepID=A0ABT2BLP4_9BURK|nr:DUF2946 family protein [Massilia solisilvae]MCS0609316.1 DUF2946 family protein [Massilia solisilvae]